LVDLFGAFPAVLDRHITEFFPHLFSGPGAYYGNTLGVDAFSFEGTMAWGDQSFAEMRALTAQPDPLPAEQLCGEYEQVTDIIESIRGDLGRVFSANVPNRGQIPNLPAEAIVECPCVTDAAGIRPIQQPPLPPGLAGTLATRCQWVETVVAAALTGNRRTFVQALLLDGAVTSIATANQLAADLLAVHRANLPQPWQA